MKGFQDETGSSWVATVRERPGKDYKGRYFLHLSPREGGEEVSLLEVAWNSPGTAERTLQTMSGVELRRRLRSARGRAPAQGASAS